MNQAVLAPENTSLGASQAPQRATLAYRALVLFTFLYFFRPEDFIPGLSSIPLGKIAGGIALLALIFGVKRKDRGQLPFEAKVLLLLLAHMILTIPFAFWRGGSFDTVINKFSKGVIVALLICLVITKMSQLRKLLYIQASAVALLTVGSIIVHRTMDNGRLMGIQKGILENPNDLAINIAINFPLAMAFIFADKNTLRKVLWCFSLFALLYGVVATYSRSGMIAMVITCVMCLWEFGLKGKRFMLLGATAIAGVLAVGFLAASPRYLSRIASLVVRPAAADINGSMEAHGEGSLQARSELLKESISLMLHHPIFGVGPGNFPAVTETWRVAHNTYTELGAEAGIPGLLLFLILLGSSMRRLRSIRKFPSYKNNPEVRLWASGLWAAVTGYAAGAMFASTEYNLFPYFIVGYICALYQIAAKGEPASGAGTQPGDGGRQEIGYVGDKERELAWSR
jgi:O-antigen ligase